MIYSLQHRQFTPEMGVEACTQFHLLFVFPMLVGSCDPYGDQSMRGLLLHMVLSRILLGSLVVVLQLAHRKLVAILIFISSKPKLAFQYLD